MGPRKRKRSGAFLRTNRREAVVRWHRYSGRGRPLSLF